MRLLYSKQKEDKHQFVIYHPHYKEKPRVTEFAHDHHLVPQLTAVVGEILAIFFLTHNGGACIVKLGKVNRFNLAFIIKQTFATIRVIKSDIGRHNLHK